MTALLKDSLKNCVINFDRRVIVTDLLQEYELTYEEVNKTLEEYLQHEESKGTKFLKRFLVQGVEKDSENEVYTVVPSDKDLQEWLQRLEQSQTALYSVEIAGGSKSPAYAFKPVERHAISLQSLSVRNTKLKYGNATLTNGNGSKAATVEKIDTKPAAKKASDVKNMFAKQTAAGASTSKSNAAVQPKASETAEKRSSPVKKTISPKAEKISPQEKKSKSNAASDAGSKKGINNFFGAAPKTAAIKPVEKVKEEAKSSSPQKHTEKAKKHEEKSSASKKSTKEKTPPPSSDSEEEIESSVLEEPEIEKPDWRKRCRIVDTDDSEDEARQPPPKVEKKDSPTKNSPTKDSPTKDSPKQVNEIEVIEDEEVQPKSETYLDEDGFVITIKPKNKNASRPLANKKSPKAISPRKTPKKEAQKSSAKAPAAKTKQGNIMNFFSKK